MSTDTLSSRDFVTKIALNLGKKATDFEKHIVRLEDNWVDNIGALKALSDEQWKELQIPFGLVN